MACDIEVRENDVVVVDESTREALFTIFVGDSEVAATLVADLLPVSPCLIPNVIRLLGEPEQPIFSTKQEHDWRLIGAFLSIHCYMVFTNLRKYVEQQNLTEIEYPILSISKIFEYCADRRQRCLNVYLIDNSQDFFRNFWQHIPIEVEQKKLLPDYLNFIKERLEDLMKQQCRVMPDVAIIWLQLAKEFSAQMPNIEPPSSGKYNSTLVRYELTGALLSAIPKKNIEYLLQ